MRNLKVALAAACAVVVGWAFTAVAATCTYTGSWDVTPTSAEDAIVIESGTLTWDASLPQTVASWTQSAGTVTFDTGLEEFAVAGDITLNGGEWTHTANPSIASSSEGWKSGRGTKQLIIRCGGDFTIGATAAVHGDVKGFKTNEGPGCKIAEANQGSAHGSSGNGDGYKCYGSLFVPVTIGSGGNHGGGGGAVRTSRSTTTCS